MKKILIFSLLLGVTSDVFAIPTITKSVSTGLIFKFTETLSEKLPTGYKVKIDLNNGKGFVAMTCSGTICTLSSNNLPKVDNQALMIDYVYSAEYNVGIFDAKGVLITSIINGNYSISTLFDDNMVPIVTRSYTKISNLGKELPDTAKLGKNLNDWACTQDNETGLIWEVKTDDNGLRDKDWYYSWYKPKGDNGGNAGYTDIDNEMYGAPNCSTKNNCNTYTFTNAVNAKGLCGKKDWRMPTIDELKGLLTTESTINQPLNELLNIDANYFPNTDSFYWSSSPYANGSNDAGYVYFGFDGDSNFSNKDNAYYVRLVR